MTTASETIPDITCNGLPLPMSELRAIAGALLARRRARSGIGATSLVHEAWLKLAAGGAPVARDENHFLAIASRAMRFVLVDRARSRLAARRGHGVAPQVIEEGWQEPAAPAPDERILAVDEALSRLAFENPRSAEIVELRFFGGLDVNETAGALGISPATVKREFAVAKERLAGMLQTGR